MLTYITNECMPLEKMLARVQKHHPGDGCLLVKKAYSVTYGARNLRRTIQKELEDPISEAIIDSFQHPISAIRIRVEGETVKLDIT